MQDGIFAAYILSQPGITPREVADRLGVSIRTVRTYVSQTNATMDGFAHIDLERGCGYTLAIDDVARFEDWTRKSKTIRGDELPQTPDQRIAYLLNDLLMRSDWITLDDLSRILCVSRSAVSNDIKCVERTLGRFGLTLEKRPHYGLRVVGPEMARRVCLASVIMKAYDEYGGGTPCPLRSQVIAGSCAGAAQSQKLIDIVSACVAQVTDAERFRINAIAYQNLLVHISIALIRINDGYNVPMPVEHLEELQQTREYAIAYKIAAALAGKTGVELPEEEIAYIGIHLAGKQTLSYAPDDEDRGLVISEEVWGVVTQMLDLVWSVYRFDFRNDLELRMNLARHIVPLSVRLQYRMSVKNPLLADIKVRYPLAYAMAMDSSSALADRYGSKLSDDEVGYIALAFALALERQKTAAAKKNILVVCASGAGSARLLEYRVRREFGEYINQATVCNVLDVGDVDFSTIDYVFTTVPLNQEVPVPVREVKYFLDDSEVAHVKEFLRKDAEPDGDITQYFDRRLFFPHLSLANKQEVLDFLIDRASGKHKVAANFRELVWKREETVATSFGNNVAMPHPLEPASRETFVCVGLLDQPVVWDEFGRTVQVVFLSSFSADAGLAQQALYSRLADMLVSRRAMRALVDDQSWDTLAALLSAFSSLDLGEALDALR